MIDYKHLMKSPGRKMKPCVLPILSREAKQ